MQTEQERTGGTRNRLLDLYQEGIGLFGRRSYEECTRVLLEIKENYPDEAEVLSRVDSYLKACRNRLSQPQKSGPQTPESLFDLGVIEHNAGHFNEALQYYVRALQTANRDLDYVLYAMAATEIRLGNPDQALTYLRRAIVLKDANRFTARNDPDFEPLRQNQEFLAVIRQCRSER